MRKKLSPAFIELTQDALLKAFWHKPALRLFLEQHKISEKALAKWHSDQTKRDFVTWLWPLLAKDDKGQDAILSMARSLIEMDHFPDLERKEDTAISIPKAKQAIARLRSSLQSLNETIHESKMEEGRRRAEQARIAERNTRQQSLSALKERLNEITSALGTQTGGYKFEEWFYDLAVHFEVDARPGYRADGRQIDGALTIEGTTYLVETKFTQEPIGSQDIDIFMAKIESKADNTMGIFVSMSGFNAGAIKAASKQKTPMLLLDQTHIVSLVMQGLMNLPAVVSRVKRHASQTGESFLDAKDFSQ